VSLYKMPASAWARVLVASGPPAAYVSTVHLGEERGVVTGRMAVA
jgi:hypothetical protein